MPWKLVAIVFVALVLGACLGAHERIAISSRGSRLSPAAAPELHAIVERLCVVADLAKPTIVLDRSRAPQQLDRGHRPAAASGCTSRRACSTCSSRANSRP